MDPNGLLMAALGQCGDVVVGQGGLLASLFLTGLIGGLSHCAGMCGPFVLSQVAARLESVPAGRMREWHRLSGAALLPYHLGRASTYAALGGLGAMVAGALVHTAGLKWLSAGLLLAAALVLLGMAAPGLKAMIAPGSAEEGWWSRRVGRFARPLFETPVGWRGFGLGVLLGFVPCGLVYGALAAAAAGGSALTGVFGMIAFAAGTVPSLFAVGLAGHLAARRFRAVALAYAPILLLLNAGVLTLLAWRQAA
ncbi:MAG: sulfite exporter TauE/SafE family protein [Alphaproteobacteria bacterium]|nr:sulfite exporter TauE/SafE family protein [Alphaproteobacteria bacterium]